MSDVYTIYSIDPPSNGFRIIYVTDNINIYVVMGEESGDYQVGKNIELWPRYKFKDGHLVLSDLVIPPKEYAKIRKELQSIRDLLVEIELGVKKQWQRKNLK